MPITPREKLSQIARKSDLLSSFVKYIAFGGTNFLASLSLIAFLVEFVGFGEATAGALGFVALFFLNFTAARWVVFHSNENSILRQLIFFAAVSAVLRLGEYGIYWFLLSYTHLPYYFVFFLVLPTSNVMKFFIYKKLVF